MPLLSFLSSTAFLYTACTLFVVLLAIYAMQMMNWRTTKILCDVGVRHDLVHFIPYLQWIRAHRGMGKQAKAQNFSSSQQQGYNAPAEEKMDSDFDINHWSFDPVFFPRTLGQRTQHCAASVSGLDRGVYGFWQLGHSVSCRDVWRSGFRFSDKLVQLTAGSIWQRSNPTHLQHIYLPILISNASRISLILVDQRINNHLFRTPELTAPDN